MSDSTPMANGRTPGDSSRNGFFPQARSSGILVEELDGETLVYDLGTHNAHCLNKAAALVWSRSDGRTSVEALADVLPEVGLPRDIDLIWLALEDLDRAGLLSECGDAAPKSKVSRRELLRALSAAAGLTLVFPALSSVVAPLAAQAASCLTQAQCRSLTPPACGGLPICTNRSKCCTTVTSRSGSICKVANC